MINKVFLFCSLFAFCTATLLARSPAPAVPSKTDAAAQASPIAIAPMKFEHSQLENGLHVYTVEDHASPTVAVQVWYHVGSKDDPQGRSGFAHLFEHMLFKGNENLKPETFEALTENIGGENNAFTADDVTVYFETIPSNYLESIIWAEAERMSSLALNDANFASERDVVKEEYRQRIAANPYGEFRLEIEKKSFAVHPYNRPGIGSIEDLNAAQLAEIKQFHSTYYRPDNATLVVVGDFDPAELNGWIKKYFGAIPKPPGEIPRVSAKEPPRAEEKRHISYTPKAPLPAVAVTYLGPSVRAEDAKALIVAQEILAGGESSRLYQTLVYQKQLTTQVMGVADLREDLGLIFFSAVLAGGKTVPAVEKALNEELQKLMNEGVTAAELEKAKTRILTGKLFGRETNNGKANDLGEAAVIYGDPNRVNTSLAELQAVTAAQVKDVLKRYLGGKRVVIEYLPEAMKGKEGKKS